MPSRKDDLLVAMATEDLDALVLGREANVHAATGAARLWLAGTRPFTASCVVVRATGEVVVPARTWNPARLGAMLRAVDGLPGARRIGVDGMNAAGQALLEHVATGAELVDATGLIARVVRIKTGDELDALRAAAAVTRDAFAEMARALAPGVTAAHLRGVFAAAAGVAGVPTPAFDAITALAGTDTWWSATQPVAAGIPVVLRGGVVREGWEASLARTYVDGTEVTPRDWPERVDACRPGGRASDAGVTHGVGRGIEPVGADERLQAGMVVAVEADDGTAFRQDVVVVHDAGPEVLTA